MPFLIKNMASHKPHKFIYTLTDQQKNDIWQMFFGPYKDEWRDANGIVENADSDISKRLNIPKYAVIKYLILACNEYFKELDNERNNGNSKEKR